MGNVDQSKNIKDIFEKTCEGYTKEHNYHKQPITVMNVKWTFGGDSGGRYDVAMLFISPNGTYSAGIYKVFSLKWDMISEASLRKCCQSVFKQAQLFRKNHIAYLENLKTDYPSSIYG